MMLKVIPTELFNCLFFLTIPIIIPASLALLDNVYSDFFIG